MRYAWYTAIAPHQQQLMCRGQRYVTLFIFRYLRIPKQAQLWWGRFCHFDGRRDSVAQVFPAPLLACLRGALKNVSEAFEQSKCEPADPIAGLVAAMRVSVPPGPFVQPASKERREYFAELWNQKKPRVGAPRKKRVVEGRAQGKAPAHGASKKRARAQGASPRNSKKKGRPTNKKKLQAGAGSQMIASFFKPSA